MIEILAARDARQLPARDALGVGLHAPLHLIKDRLGDLLLGQLPLPQERGQAIRVSHDPLPQLRQRKRRRVDHLERAIGIIQPRRAAILVPAPSAIFAAPRPRVLVAHLGDNPIHHPLRLVPGESVARHLTRVGIDHVRRPGVGKLPRHAGQRVGRHLLVIAAHLARLEIPDPCTAHAQHISRAHVLDAWRVHPQVFLAGLEAVIASQLARLVNGPADRIRIVLAVERHHFEVLGQCRPKRRIHQRPT